MLCFYRWEAGSKVKLNGFLAHESDTDSDWSDSVGALGLFVCLFSFSSRRGSVVDVRRQLSYLFKLLSFSERLPYSPGGRKPHPGGRCSSRKRCREIWCDKFQVLVMFLEIRSREESQRSKMPKE